MVLPMLNHASPSIDQNMECMKLLDSVQKRLFSWICPDLDYREALQTFNILPLPYYLQLFNLITFSKALNNFHDADFTEHFLTSSQHYSTRIVTSKTFQRPWNKKCAQKFWFRTARLANLC